MILVSIFFKKKKQVFSTCESPLQILQDLLAQRRVYVAPVVVI